MPPRRLAVLCVLAASLAASAGDDGIRFEYTLDPDLVLGYDASEWPPREVEPSDDPVWIGRNLAAWFDRVADLGVNVVTVSTFTREGDLYMTSPALKAAGFRATPAGDLFELYCVEAKRLGVVLSVPLEDIAHIVQGNKEFDSRIDPKRLKIDRVVALIAEIAAYARRHAVELWVTEEAFDDAGVSAIAKAAAAHGLKHLHFFPDPRSRPDLCVSEDYATYPRGLDRDDAERETWRVISAWGGSTLGLGALVFGSQAASGKPAGVATSGGWGLQPGCEVNVALLRTCQFAPSYYSFVEGWTAEWPDVTEADARFCRTFDYRRRLQPLIEELRKRPTASRPVANLILCPPRRAAADSDAHDLFDASVVGSADAVTNALLAAGFDLRVTQDAPCDGAALRYVIAAGRCEEVGMDEDLPDAIARLIDQEAPIVVQSIGAPGGGAGWRRATAALGLPSRPHERAFSWEEPLRSPIPEQASWEFANGGATSIRFRGFVLADDPENLGRSALYHVFSELGEPPHAKVRVRSTEGEVLVTEREGRWFVNGNFLHLEFSQVLANLVADGDAPFEAPTYAYVSTDRERSAVFAAADTEVRVRVRSGTRVRQWDASGTAMADPTVRVEDGVLTGRLGRWQLAIVTER